MSHGIRCKNCGAFPSEPVWVCEEPFCDEVCADDYTNSIQEDDTKLVQDTNTLTKPNEISVYCTNCSEPFDLSDFEQDGSKITGANCKKCGHHTKPGDASDKHYLDAIEKFDEFMNSDFIDDETKDLYFHGVRGWMSVLSARLAVAKAPKDSEEVAKEEEADENNRD